VYWKIPDRKFIKKKDTLTIPLLNPNIAHSSTFSSAGRRHEATWNGGPAQVTPTLQVHVLS
jgi:hypothetical protein